MNTYFWKWTLVLGLLAGSTSWAQQEPTLNDIYATAQAGKLDQAQVMVQQVLVSHPNSAKAHYVRSELYARQGQMTHAREALAKAEQLAPGLPFAKPEAVQALRAEIAGAATASRGLAPAGNTAVVRNAAPAPAGGGWALPVLLAGGVLVAAYFIFRRRAAPVQVLEPGYANANAYNQGLSGPQTFGNPQPANAYGSTYNPGYNPAYGPQAGSGLGGKIMGGVATGLAVGAGVMAAQAIGRNLMGGHDSNHDSSTSAMDAGTIPIDNRVNSDMGGADFGISDTSSWDDPGSSGGSSGDWDT